jgi:DNA-directed RNA polymerase specialized sigma24 family protein
MTTLDEIDDIPTPEGKRYIRDLQIDLLEAIERLPPILKRTAEVLGHFSASEIAEREGVHKGTIYRRLERIRERLDDGTLREYLEP